MLVVSFSRGLSGDAAAGHNRTVRSWLAVARRLPSGLNATLPTRSVCPVSGSPTGFAGIDVPQPHRTVGAGRGQPVAIRTERHTENLVGVPGQRDTDGLAGVYIPEPHRPVDAGRRQLRPVGAERHVQYLVLVAGKGVPDQLAGVGVPQADRGVVVCGGESVPSGLYARLMTEMSPAVRGSPTGSPLSTAGCCTAPSSPPAASFWLSGLNATVSRY